jgi:transcriptional regulator with XRE-family HTH domain
MNDLKDLRYVLLELGYAPKDFANLIGVTDMSVYKWLNGKAKPCIEMRLKIEKATNNMISRHYWDKISKNNI